MMNNTILLNECSSEFEFFDRFGADKEEQKTYMPLILSIEYSHGGEVAESYGVFLNSKNKCLYKVYGSECSVWDFNGQFSPELITFDEFDSLLIKENISEKLTNDMFINLENLGINKEGIYLLNNSYCSYLNSFNITENHDLKMIQKEVFAHLFQDQLVKVEDTIAYYEFITNYGYEQKYYVDFNYNNSVRVSTNLDKNESSFDSLFISDLLGSIELEENIFMSNTTETKKLKI